MKNLIFFNYISYKFLKEPIYTSKIVENIDISKQTYFILGMHVFKTNIFFSHFLNEHRKGIESITLTLHGFIHGLLPFGLS